MNRTKAALIATIVAVTVITAAIAAAVLLNVDDGGKKTVDPYHQVTIGCDPYTKFYMNGDGPWGDGGGSYKDGTKISLKAVTEIGHFDGYYVGDKRVCADESYEFTVESDISIRLAAKDVAVVKMNGNGCTLYVNGIGSGDSCEKAVTAGTPMTVYAVSAEGSVVTGWAGSCTSDYPVCSFSADSDMELSVTTRKATNPTSIVRATTANPNAGSIIAYGQNVGNAYGVRLEQSGDPLLLSAEAKEGHSFMHWLMGDGDVSYEASITVYAKADDQTLTAVLL